MDEVRDLLDWARDFTARPSVGVPLSPSAARSRMVIQFVDRFMAEGRNTLTGYDASAHVAEETVQAAARVPRAIVQAVWVSGVFGWALKAGWGAAGQRPLHDAPA